MLNKRKAHAHTFFQPMVSAFSRKSRRVIIRPYFLMRPWWEPEHLQHRRQHPHALAETFKHFIFYDTIRTPACAAQRSRKYIAERRRNACESDKKSKCSSREKETWNRTTSTDSLYSQFPAQRKVKLSSGTGLIQQNASPNVKFTIQGTQPSIRAALPPVLLRLSAPCKGPMIQISVCASPPKFNPVSLSWRAAAALVWMRQHKQQV
jgi:hypothetical protein